MDTGIDSARCAWAQHESQHDYHDGEWGVPLHDDAALFEFITLEGAQAGLSWNTILQKRANYRAAFAGFDAQAVASYGDAKRAELLADAGIVRHAQKIDSTIANAQAILAVQESHGSLDAYLWNFVDGVPVQNNFASVAQLPASTPQSAALSKQLKKDGFRFMGPTTCYAFMEAVGMVNDHVISCPRHAELS